MDGERGIWGDMGEERAGGGESGGDAESGSQDGLEGCPPAPGALGLLPWKGLWLR